MQKRVSGCSLGEVGPEREVQVWLGRDSEEEHPEWWAYPDGQVRTMFLDLLMTHVTAETPEARFQLRQAVQRIVSLSGHQRAGPGEETEPGESQIQGEDFGQEGCSKKRKEYEKRLI